MSLLANLLENIASEGSKLKRLLGNDQGHLFDIKPWKYDEELPTREAWEASQSVIADCEQLIALLTPTKLKLTYESISNNAAIALETAADLKIADHIIENGGEASLNQLAKAAKTSAHKLGCTLRVLTHRHVFVEVAPNVFRNNRHSYELRAETGARELILLETQEGYRSGPGWLQIMKDPKRMHSIDAKDGAFAEVYTGGKKGIFEYIGTPEGATCLNNMNIGVPWMSTITVVATRTDVQWDQYGKTVCDVGAGLGSVMLEVKKKFPHLNVVCQELEHMIPVMEQTFKDRKKEIQDGSIKLEVHDYFTPQTTIADVYWLRGVIREYEDDTAAKVLENLKFALKKNPKAKILVNELFLPSLVTSQASANVPGSKNISKNQSGWPLICELQQLSGQQLFSGKERTFDEIARIGEAAGLRVVKYHRFRMFTGAVEFELPPESKL